MRTLASPNSRGANVSGRDRNDEAAMLSRQPVVRGCAAVPDEIGISYSAGQSKKIAFSHGIESLVRGNEDVFPPACTFKPAFLSEGFDDVVGRLRTGTKKLDDF